MLGYFNPILGQIWTNPNVGLGQIWTNPNVGLRWVGLGESCSWVKILNYIFNPTFGFVHI